ncbi:type 4a pilus biogenesis protein PilO [Patescibacteria group bacterium]|nr:type 4a pilus biogenesis protein PilO [Patescibacteria group bacterium]MBU1921800.1 type 4a pilus biogenesis protein PilO [Patescibacteria group bacterium]
MLKAKLEQKNKKRPGMPSLLWIGYYKTVVIFCLLALGAFAWSLLIGPAYDEYRALGMELDLRQTEQAQYQNTLNQFNQIVAQWSEISELDKAKLDYFVPTEQDIPGLIAMLDQIAAQSGFGATRVTLSYADEPAIPKTDIYPILVSASIEGGGYAQLKQFISKIESNLRLTDLNSLSFQSGKGVYILNLTTYYLKKS